MIRSRLACSVFQLLWVFALIPVGSAQASVSEDPRYQYAANLIYRSRGAEKIRASADSQLLVDYKQIQQLYQSALAEKDRDPEAANQMLDQSLVQMIKAIAQAAPAASRTNKLRQDFLDREKSVDTLLDAHQRIALELERDEIASRVNEQVGRLVQEAGQLRDTHQYAQARLALDAAYELVKSSIAGLRGGATLIRTLQFSSPREEYLYEFDRHETYRMLIKVLLLQDADLPSATLVHTQLQQREAERLRLLATESAAAGEYVEAIEKIEASSEQLLKAIRYAGIYIPG